MNGTPIDERAGSAAAGPGDEGTLAAGPADDVAGLLAVCDARVLEREGIAMFVALHDARPGRVLAVADDVARAEGARLGELFDHYRAGVPDRMRRPDDPTGAARLIDVLVVLSDRHLRSRAVTP